MPWTGSSPSQTAQRTDGTRSGTDTWQQASAASVKIVSTAHDTHDQDVVTMLNACVKKDGGNSASLISMDSAAVINWNSGDVTITHASNALLFEGGSSGYKFDAAPVPTSSDGAALGSTSLQWSDVFLAEGGVINWDNGDVTLTQSGNSLTVAGGNLIFDGTATNDSASAGQVGEVISSNIATGSSVSLTNNTPANVTSISLTAGDWDVWGNVAFAPGGSTTFGTIAASIGQTSATIGTLGLGNPLTSLQLSFTTGNQQFLAVAPARISLASTTTVYLVANAVFAVSTMNAYGFIQARRAR